MAIILKKLKSLLLFFVTLWKRAFCCFRRRRRSSCKFEPLTNINVVSNQKSGEVENWEDWNAAGELQNRKPATIQEHIEVYRQQAIAARQQQEKNKEQQLDFFEDMTPRITTQAKIFIDNKTQEKPSSNRLSLYSDLTLKGSELEEWEENLGWEGETLDVDAQQALREKRRQERERRMWEQQQKRQERLSKPIALGERLYS